MLSWNGRVSAVLHASPAAANSFGLRFLRPPFGASFSLPDPCSTWDGFPSCRPWALCR